MKVYVTGVGGFVGRHLARELLAHGHEVGGSHLGPVEDLPEIRVDQLDLLDPGSIRTRFETFAPEVVVHLAGFSHVGSSWKAPAQCFRVNVLGTEAVLEALEAHDPTARIVFASSSEVYGEVPAEEQPIRDGREPAPGNPYALTKAAAERLVLARGGVIARSFNLIGPGQSEQFAIPGFARQLAQIEAGQVPPVMRVGDLSPRRDFVDVRDGAVAYRLLVEGGEMRQCYNVASGHALAIAEVVDRLVEISGVEVTIEQDPTRLRQNDTTLFVGDATRLRSLGWQPRFDLDTSLLELWRGARAHLGRESAAREEDS